MISEILFRGKSLESGKWVYGYFVNTHWYLNNKDASIIIPIDSTLYPHCELSSFEFVDLETVGQWTGLVDKNGVKIFGGDVVRYKHTFRFHSSETIYEHIKDEPETVYECKGIVEYSDGKFTPIPYRYDCEDDYYYSHADFDFEVIDNIWDNPELGGK